MNKLKAILALLAGNFIKDLGEAFDRNFTSREERDAALIEKEKLYNERLQIIAEMTEPDPDSWLSKNIRPLLMLIAFLTFAALMIFQIEVDPGLMKTFARWTGIMVTFYFGAREVVKAIKRKKN